MTTTDKRTSGAYVAYDDDWSGMAVFSSEVEALRYAVERSMKVRRVSYGVDLREAVTVETPAPRARQATIAPPMAAP